MDSSRSRLVAVALLVTFVAACRGAAATPTTQPSLVPPTAEATVDATIEPPPQATLVVGERRMVGVVGSYVWKGGTDAAPWLPAEALEPFRVPAGSAAVLEIADDQAVETWTVRADTASDPSGTDPLPLAEGRGAASFAAPEPGMWVVQIQVQFPGGLGDASWYWSLVVE